MEGEIVEILERGVKTLTGTLRLGGKFVVVVPDDDRIGRDIYVPREETMKAAEGDKVKTAPAPVRKGVKLTNIQKIQLVQQTIDEQIRPAPDLAAALETQYVTGLGAIAERMLILIDIETLIGSRDMGLLDPKATETA